MEVVAAAHDDRTPNYKERFIQEYHQLVDRRNKLHKMLIKLDAGTLDFKPSCPSYILKQQEYVMNSYIDILETRAEIENVNLSDTSYDEE